MSGIEMDTPESHSMNILYLLYCFTVVSLDCKFAVIRLLQAMRTTF